MTERRRGPKKERIDDLVALRAMVQLVARGVSQHRAAWAVVETYPGIGGASRAATVDRLRRKFRKHRMELMRSARSWTHHYRSVRELLAAADGPWVRAARQSEAVYQYLAAATSPHLRAAWRLMAQLPDHQLDEICPTTSRIMSKTSWKLCPRAAINKSKHK
jgi:hypothetical protein